MWVVELRRVVALVCLVGAGCGDSSGTTGTAGTGGETGTGGSGTGGGAACPTDYAECDGNAATVCETSLQSSPAHCGACDAPCAEGGAHQLATCLAAECGLVCESGHSDCNGDPTDGCEVTGADCSVVTLASDVDSPTGLSVDDGYVYFGTRGHGPNWNDGTVERVAKTGGAREVLVDTENKPFNLTIDDAFVYWDNRGDPDAANGGIYGAPKDGMGAGRFTIAEGLEYPANVIVDDTTAYWTTRESGTTPGALMMAPKDGSGTVTTIAADLWDPRDLQLVDGQLYWVTGGSATMTVEPAIRRIALPPTGAVETISTGISTGSWHFAVDAAAVYVGSFETQTLYSVPLAGGPADVLATGVFAVQEIVLDDATSTIFFTTGSGGTVLSIPKTGAAMPTQLASGSAYTSYLTQDTGAIYWTDGVLSAPGGSIKKRLKP